MLTKHSDFINKQNIFAEYKKPFISLSFVFSFSLLSAAIIIIT